MWIVYRYITCCGEIDLQEFTGPFDTLDKCREWSAKFPLDDSEFYYEEFHQLGSPNSLEPVSK